MDYAFRNTLTRFLLVFTVLALLAGTVWAQGSWRNHGSGDRSTRRGVADVDLTLINSATGDKRTTTTSSAGTYRSRLCRWSEPTLWSGAEGLQEPQISDIVIR